MISVISPAKNLNFSALEQDIPTSQPELLPHTEVLMETTRGLTKSNIKDLMKLSDNLAQLNWDRFQNFSTPFTSENAKPAVLTFNGDTYKGLDASTLNDEQLQFAQGHLVILSGLYGLLKPLDLIQPYRLEMGTRLQNPRGKNLYNFWKGHITQTLSSWLAEHEHNHIVNLASNEYFKAVDPKLLPGPVITPVFKELRGGKAKIISFSAKRARGMMARYIITQGLDNPEGMKDFNEAGYSFKPELSNETEWVFLRPQP